MDAARPPQHAGPGRGVSIGDSRTSSIHALSAGGHERSAAFARQASEYKQASMLHDASICHDAARSHLLGE